MLPENILARARKENARIGRMRKDAFRSPPYNPATNYLDLTRHPFYDGLVCFRHFIQEITHYYFGDVKEGKSVDLFMLTPSISSPMGSGSDSEPIPISFGGLESFLVDSGQFGFEPLLFHEHELLYCYLPSMRGEEHDARHLNQFYHCECEMVGSLEDVMKIAEGYVRHLGEMALALPAMIGALSEAAISSNKALSSIVNQESFPRLEFDDVAKTLTASRSYSHTVIQTKHGRDITPEGELAIFSLYQLNSPVWILHYDRDRVPFYQKPLEHNPNQVENADLLFPPLIKGAFGGEILGAGQRQDSAEQILESLSRQDHISPAPYQWYINLRNEASYQPTSGFGLGIERFLAWSLAKSDIREMSLYPRLKGVKTYP